MNTDKKISRREALKRMGFAVMSGAIASSGLLSLASCETKRSITPIKGNGLRRKPCRFPVRREENGLLPQGLSPFAQGSFLSENRAVRIRSRRASNTREGFHESSVTGC